MTRQEKISAILSLREQKNLSNTDIYAPGKGVSISRLEQESRGEKPKIGVSDTVVDIALENAKKAETKEGKPARKAQTKKTPMPEKEVVEVSPMPETNGERKEIESLREAVSNSQKQIGEMAKEIEMLKQSLANVVSNSQVSNSQISQTIRERKPVGIHVFGFQVVQKIKGNQVYTYANKVVKGKIHWVYIGKDSSLAESKIRDYCQEHGIELKEECEK